MVLRNQFLTFSLYIHLTHTYAVKAPLPSLTFERSVKYSDSHPRSGFGGKGKKKKKKKKNSSSFRAEGLTQKKSPF